MYRLIQKRALMGCLALVMSGLFSGCSSLSLVNILGSGKYQVSLDHAYGSEPRQKLDIYIPDRQVALASAKPADVVLFFYGGSWRTGDKADHRFVAKGLAQKGLIIVIADYRLYPEVDWRDFLKDGASAYRWVAAHIAEYGGEPRRIFVMGHSAGAHIAAMVALDQQLRIDADNQIAPCGLIGLAGPYDFLPFSETGVAQVFSSASDLQLTQPIHYADGRDPSALLLTGDADKRVDPGNSTRLANALTRAGGKAEVIIYPNVGHPGILLSLSPALSSIAPTLRDIGRFVTQTHCAD